jgi:hypothetical protein
MKIANRDARKYVQAQRSFRGSNLWGEHHHQPEEEYRRYVVYSYGTHWPLFIYTCGQWFENEDRYSVTTSKHRTQAHPGYSTKKLTAQWMVRLAEEGYSALARARVIEGEPA